MTNPTTPRLGRDAQGARHRLEALHLRHRPGAAYRGLHHSLDEQLRLVGLIMAIGGSLSELARELDVPLDYLRALAVYLDQWTADTHDSRMPSR